MQSGWNSSSPVASVMGSGAAVTLVEGQTFCLSAASGDIVPEHPQGLFVMDTRVLSRFELRLNGREVETLAASVDDPYAAQFVCRGAPPPDRADSEMVLMRYRHIGNGMRERLVLTNHGRADASCRLELWFDSDFADLFEVKEARVHRAGHYSQEAEERTLVFEHVGPNHVKRVRIGFSEIGELEPARAAFARTLGPSESWELCIQLDMEVDGARIPTKFRCGASDDQAMPGKRMASWRARLPDVTTDNPYLSAAIEQSGEDLGALRIFDPEHPEIPILAAGAPWFMTVFGRDSLLTGWMTLPADPSLALGVLQTLARFQGERVDLETEEEPGKILHEMRFGASAGLSLREGNFYFGSIDATPLFVMLLGEARRWGADEQAIADLLPHADRALQWIEHFGDRDGDGYVEYQRSSAEGLTNQGWKDSWDAIRFADGTMAEPPIALCEVQGYVYAAYLARAHFAEGAGDLVTSARYVRMARELRRRFNEDFWMDDQGTYALGLDANKRQIDAVASNVGHCLWTGIVDPQRAPLVAERLMRQDMFSGWGIRTLASSMSAYNPVSYHNGSVWPHDNALCAAGMARFGLTEPAMRIVAGQIDASSYQSSRVPELFAGFSRTEVSVPAAYPASCSPQAWSASAPLSWLRTILRLDPLLSHGSIWLAPTLPESVRRLRVSGIQIGGQALTVRVEGSSVKADYTGSAEVLLKPRPPLSALLGGDQRDV